MCVLLSSQLVLQPRLGPFCLVWIDCMGFVVVVVLQVLALRPPIATVTRTAPMRARRPPASSCEASRPAGLTPLPSHEAAATPRAAGPSEVAVFVMCWAVLVACAVAAIATRGHISDAHPAGVWREVLAGGIAAAVGESIFFPIEKAKFRLQQRQSTRSLVGELRSLLDEARCRGSGYPCSVAGVLRACMYHGLRLGLFPPVRRALTAALTMAGGSAGSVPLLAKVAIGAACGALGAALCSPLDLVKARMAVSPEAHPNSLAALMAIALGHDARTLWRGGAATVVRAAMGSGAQLAAYDSTKRAFAASFGGADSPRLAAISIFLATVVSAAAHTTASAPADVVKTRLMLVGDLSGGSGEKRRAYAGPLDCLRQSVSDEGIGVLFRGWGASYARLLPSMLLVMPLLEQLRALFGVGAF